MAIESLYPNQTEPQAWLFINSDGRCFIFDDVLSVVDESGSRLFMRHPEKDINILTVHDKDVEFIDNDMRVVRVNVSKSHIQESNYCVKDSM